MKSFIFLFILAIGSNVANADEKSNFDVVCSFAPSQSDAVKNLFMSAGGAGLTVNAITAATGLSAVTHSSGAYILTGSSGYVAGTLGSAGIVPFISSVTLAYGATVASVELLCVPKNHPELVTIVTEASEEFANITKSSFNANAEKVIETKNNIILNVISIVSKATNNNVFK